MSDVNHKHSGNWGGRAHLQLEWLKNIAEKKTYAWIDREKDSEVQKWEANEKKQ